jgi:thiol-disulfide isomerase/thioredoxin
MNTLLCRLILLLSLSAALAAPAATPGEVPVGGVLRDAPMKGLNGPSMRMSQLRGTPLIINVWASWCGPCQQEMASLERLAWLDLPVHFKIIGISTDDDAAAAQALLSRTNATLSHYIDERLALENMLGASHLPLTLLVDADGRVLRKIVGARQWDSPESVQLIVAAFLQSAPAGRGRRPNK